MEITPQSNLLHVHVINFGTKSDQCYCKGVPQSCNTCCQFTYTCCQFTYTCRINFVVTMSCNWNKIIPCSWITGDLYSAPGWRCSSLVLSMWTKNHAKNMVRMTIKKTKFKGYYCTFFSCFQSQSISVCKWIGRQIYWLGWPTFAGKGETPC